MARRLLHSSKSIQAISYCQRDSSKCLNPRQAKVGESGLMGESGATTTHSMVVV